VCSGKDNGVWKGETFLSARCYASAGNSDRNVSVCPSVTRRYYVKTKKDSGMIPSPSGSPKTEVFWRQILSPNSKGFPRTGALKKGGSEKFSDFYPRDAMLARVIVIATCLSVPLSVCPSVCPSVTRRYCVKTKKASVVISSPSGSTKTLVFWR